jgi:hypothetical protein
VGNEYHEDCLLKDFVVKGVHAFDCLKIACIVLPVVEPPKDDLAQSHTLRGLVAVYNSAASLHAVIVLFLARVNDYEVWRLMRIFVVRVNELKVL